MNKRAALLTAYLLVQAAASAQPAPLMRFPADKATGVNPDTHLVLTFRSAPILGKSGQIRIYDAADGKLVDTLDLSIPPGPTAAGGGPNPPYTPTPYEYTSGRLTNANTMPGTPSGAAAPTSRDFQLTIIGGFTDAFHFYPVIVHENVATIYPHNNLLQYNKTYYVQIDPGVLTEGDGSFRGFRGNSDWTFRTKTAPPPAGSARLVVAADGTGDFNTVQGAIDAVPDGNPNRVTIFIRNGAYEEIVYFRNKTNITITEKIATRSSSLTQITRFSTLTPRTSAPTNGREPPVPSRSIHGGQLYRVSSSELFNQEHDAGASRGTAADGRAKHHQSHDGCWLR